MSGPTGAAGTDLGVPVGRLRLLGVLLGLAVVVAVGVVLVGGDLAAVRDAVDRAGPWAPVAYVGLHVLLTLVPVPKNLLVTIAGALFGVGGGLVLAWVAAVTSAGLGFALARRVGQTAVSGLDGRRVRAVQRLLREQGVAAVVVLRLTPVLPFTVVTWLAGVSALRRRDFLLGTAVGVVPGTVAYVLVGASVGGDARMVLLGGGAALLLLVATAVVGRRLRARTGA